MTTPAEEARTLLARTTTASLATVSEDGGPWASFVQFGVLEDGSPVLSVSTLAEHGRNLQADPRASVVVVEPGTGGDPLARGRVTLAGRAEIPTGDEAVRALEAYESAVGPADGHAGWGDFTTWVLRVERVRWVGGYGRMATIDVADFTAARATLR